MSPPSYDRYEFIAEAPEMAITCIVFLGLASLVGTFGNFLILIVIARTKELRQTQSIFIVNMAMSDIYVTLIADPMSIIGKIEGRPFFESRSTLCTIIAKLCTISCINSLGSISLLSFNRYVFICHNTYYQKIFNARNCIIMCVFLYCVGVFMVCMNLLGIGDHNFDDKSLECIWDRMATYSYTVILIVCLVWIPVLVVGASYMSLFLHVREKRKQIMNHDGGNQSNQSGGNKSLALAKTIFIVYAIFSLCWIPFAVLWVADVNNTISMEVHLVITVFAHMHPSINWLVYYKTNRHFKIGCQKMFGFYKAPIEGATTQVTLVSDVKTTAIK